MRILTNFASIERRSPDLVLLAVVAIGAFLRFSRLGEYDNPYYTATVASMLQNWHNFLFVASDPAGLVMVDKPPLSFWIQAIPGAFLGVTGWSVALPQAIVGSVSIFIIYWCIKPAFGRLTAIVAALVLAVVPASVVVDSGNEPDALLSGLLVMASYAIVRAVRSGGWPWVVTFGVLMGLAFNTKMLVAFIPLPAFLLYYLLASRRPLGPVLVHLVGTVGILVVVSLLWVTLLAVTPSENRPYIGSTQDDSIWTLVVEYNGVNRFSSFLGPGPQKVGAQSPSLSDAQFTRSPEGSSTRALPGPQQPMGMAPPIEAQDRGLLGLFGIPLAAQLGWLLPVGLISLMGMLTPVLSDAVYSRPSKLAQTLRDSPAAAQSVLWATWLVTAVVVFGLANSTTTHPYYLVGMAPPLAGSIAIGGAVLARAFRHGNLISWLVALLILASAGYQIYGSERFVGDMVVAIVGIGTLLATLVMGIGLWRKLQNKPLAGGALALGSGVLLIIPLVLSITSEGRMLGGRVPERPLSPAVLSQGGDMETRITKLTSFFNAENDSTLGITLGTLNAREAAPFIIAGISTIAIGGFSGNDPVFTRDSFRATAAVMGPRYFLIQGLGITQRRRDSTQGAIIDHIRSQWDDVSRLVGLPAGSLFANPMLQIGAWVN